MSVDRELNWSLQLGTYKKKVKDPKWVSKQVSSSLGHISVTIILDFIFYFLGGKALRIASGTTKLLNDDLINVLDPDSTKAEISITLVPASGKILLIFSPQSNIFF